MITLNTYWISSIKLNFFKKESLNFDVYNTYASFFRLTATCNSCDTTKIQIHEMAILMSPLTLPLSRRNYGKHE